MFESQQDVMAYVRKCVIPDLFRTVTTNPKWPKILESWTPGQQPHERPLKIQNLLVAGFL